MIKTLLEKGTSDFEWVDIVNPTKEELLKIASDYNLHLNSLNDCLQPEHLPKYELINDIQFVIIRVFDIDADLKSDTIQEMTRKIAIFLGEDFIITIHRVSFNFVEEIVEKYNSQITFKNRYYIIHKLLSHSIQTYVPSIKQLASDLDTYESEIFLNEKPPSFLKKLYLIKRRAAVINKIYYLIRPILDNLKDKVPSPVYSDLQDSLTAGKIEVEQTIENTSNLLNIYISLASQRTSEVMRVLTIFSVFFMPLTFIAGIYGMNFEFMPELKIKLGYPAVLVVCASIIVAIYIWFKKKGWL